MSNTARLIRVLVVWAWLAGCASVAQAATASWHASPEADVAGYIVSYGTVSGVYTTRLNVGNVTSVLVALAPGVQYFFVFQAYNASGLISSSSAEVAFTVAAGAPAFSTPPTNQTVISGQSTSFTVAATGTPAPTYQWQISTDGGTSWTDLANTGPYGGVTTATLALTAPPSSLTGTLYRAIAMSSAGTTPSNAALLTVEDPVPPAITAHPVNQTINAGQTASFTVAASGTTPSYQWQISTDGGQTFSNLTDTAPYSGATATTLTVSAAAPGLTGAQYRAVVSNTAGVATSNPATLAVNVAPVITAQPADQIVLAGSTTSFTVAVSGTPIPTLQWQLSTNAGGTWTNVTNTAPYSGASTVTLTLSGVPAGLTTYQYRLVATNSAGSATSNAATLTVNVAPVITVQPVNQTVAAGQNAPFTIAAGGNPTPSLQWQVSTDGGVSFSTLTNTPPYAGVATVTLTIVAVPVGLTGAQYRAVAANSVGSATSNAATLTVDVPPAITTQPSSQTVLAGGNGSFTIAATGAPQPTLQWQVSVGGGPFANLTNTAPYGGVTTATLTLTAVTGGLNGNQYRAIATNRSGTAASSMATLTVNVPPAVGTQPVNQTVMAGQNASFSVAATGVPVPALQWQVSVGGGAFTNVTNAVPYSGATTPTLTVTGVTAGLTGNQYRAVATNSVGTVFSNAAVLTVSVAPIVVTQPISVTVTAGQTASFTVTATGTPAPTYQWQASSDAVTWTNLMIPSATTPTLTLVAAAWWNATRVRAVATNIGGSVTSDAVTLTVYGAVVVNPQSLSFSASKTAAGSTLGSLAPAQSTLAVGFTGQPAAWTATANQPWLQIGGGSGSGAGQITVQIVNPGNVIGGSTLLRGTITVAATAAANWPVVIPVTLSVTQTLDGTLVGSFDTPAVTAGAVQGSVALGGWALADGSLDRVEIWRDAVAGDTTPYQGAGPANGKVFVGKASTIDGARPDVEAQFANDPRAVRAGWGYLLETHGLSSRGDGAYTLYAIAYDTAGHGAILGSKKLEIDNLHATLPFGGLDAPAEGAIVSGLMRIAGWALTPGPSCTILNGAGGLVAAIDSGLLVPVAGGSVQFDTTTLANGRHQISWSITDSCGRQAWTGTRFFEVHNGDAAPAADASAILLAFPNTTGNSVVRIPEGNRLDLQLPTPPGATYAGYHRVGNTWRALPLGSSLDSRTGMFSWQPAPGFLGRYDLAFLVTTPRGATEAASVRVVVGAPVRLWMDRPSPGIEIEQPFELTGWGLDLAAVEGTGIEAVQISASPVDGGHQVLLGVATTGEARPEVAVVYGAQFRNAGFRLVVDRLPPGTYDLTTSLGTAPVRIMVR